MFLKEHPPQKSSEWGNSGSSCQLREITAIHIQSFLAQGESTVHLRIIYLPIHFIYRQVLAQIAPINIQKKETATKITIITVAFGSLGMSISFPTGPVI
jgi:hypothetical protein